MRPNEMHAYTHGLICVRSSRKKEAVRRNGGKKEDERKSKSKKANKSYF
jgi:hypothetical protein